MDNLINLWDTYASISKRIGGILQGIWNVLNQTIGHVLGIENAPELLEGLLDTTILALILYSFPIWVAIIIIKFAAR